MEKAAQRIHLPARLVSPTASKTLPGSLWKFFLLVSLVLIISVFLLSRLIWKLQTPCRSVRDGL